MKVRLGVVSVLLGGVMATGCGPDPDYVAPAVPRGDPDYAFAALRHADTSTHKLQPGDLADALPGHTVRLKGTDFTLTFSDGIVVGTVERVSKGNAVRWRGEGHYTDVDYDDPRADSRWVVVIVTPDEKIGVTANRDPVYFRVQVPEGADPDRFAEGLAGLDRVAVMLEYDPIEGQNTTAHPIMGERLIGVVADDGTLSFPALGPRRTSFAGDLRTAELLVAAARVEQSTTVVEHP